MSKPIPYDQQKALSELHLEIEKLNPSYTANLEITSWVFSSSIFDSDGIGVLNLCKYFHLDQIEIILNQISVYQKRLQHLVDNLRNEQGAINE